MKFKEFFETIMQLANEIKTQLKTDKLFLLKIILMFLFLIIVFPIIIIIIVLDSLVIKKK